jgi:hypothetical protein
VNASAKKRATRLVSAGRSPNARAIVEWQMLDCEIFCQNATVLKNSCYGL